MNIDFSDKSLYVDKFIPLLTNEKRYIFMMWGAGSGKSVFHSQKEIIKSFQETTRCLCIRKVQATIKDSVYAELCSRIKEWGLSNHFEITKSPMYIKNLVTGSDFIFRGMDDPEKIKSISNVKRIWIEEATELAPQDFDQLDLRVRGLWKQQITCTLNPVDAQNWINERFWSKGNTDKVELLHSTYLDNRFVRDQYEGVLSRMKTDNYSYYKIYALGEWGVLEGRIYDNWKTLDWVPEDARLLGYWLDFWYTNDPTALVELYKWNDGIVFHEKIYTKGLTNQDIDLRMKAEAITQDCIIADSAEPKSIEELRRMGWNVQGAKKGPDSIRNGIDKIKGYKVWYTSSSANLHNEYSKYAWKLDKNNKPMNQPAGGDDHLLDSCRYACNFLLYESMPMSTIKKTNNTFIINTNFDEAF